MSALQILGVCLMALPFVTLFIYVWLDDSLVVAVGLFVAVGAIFGLVALGSALAQGKLA